MTTFDLIYDVVCQIPQGKVASYGQVAALAGNPRWRARSAMRCTGIRGRGSFRATGS